MSSRDRDERIRDLFDEVVVLGPEERTARLAEACADDVGLRREVESLLAAADATGTDLRQELEGFRPGEDTNAKSFGEIPPSLQATLSGRYTLEHEIGRGGMATVYLAEDLKHERKVALKVLKPELAAVVGAERFLAEIKTTANMSHPHILPLHDSGEADSFLYYVMPHVEGESLRDRLDREKRLPVDEAVRIAMAVAHALEHAHRHGVIHRDIKPANILLQDGEPVVADFGISLAVGAGGSNRLTETGLSLGTPHYMSPEQATGDQVVGPTTDTYALGCVLYEMLIGEPLHRGSTPQEILGNIIAGKPVSATEQRPSIPAHVDAAIRCALEKLPADRFASTRELAAALKDNRFRHGTVGVRKQNRAVWFGAATVAAVFALGAVLLLSVLIDRGPHFDARRVAVLPLENRTGDPTLNEVGIMAADWIGQAIQQLDEVDVVASAFTRQFAESASSEGAKDLVRAIAERTDAGVVVAGTFFTIGDSLHFRTEIIDVNDGSPMQGMEEVWHKESLGEAINTLGQRVGGALTSEFDPYLRTWQGRLLSPPKLDAYREMRLGYDAFDRGDRAGSLAHHLAAYALDTTLIQAVVAATYVTDERAQRDSLARFADHRREMLSRSGQLDLDIQLAMLANDREGKLRAVRELARVHPEGYSSVLRAAFALGANLPHEALEALTHYDPYPAWRRAEATVYWEVLTEAYHLLGNHEQELVEARRAREVYPGSLDMLVIEVRALAALGRVEEVGELLNGAQTLFQDPSEAHTVAGTELRAHGHAEAARGAFEGAAEWLSTQPSEEETQPDHRRALALALYRAERWKEAGELAQGLVSESADDIVSLALVGRIAARTGDATTVKEISERIAEMSRPLRDWPVQRQPLYAQACIAALLDRPDEAMRLLREWFFEGGTFGLEIHGEIDLEPLRDREDYQELMRPKG